MADESLQRRFKSTFWIRMRIMIRFHAGFYGDRSAEFHLNDQIQRLIRRAP